MKLPILTYNKDNLDRVFARSQINDDNLIQGVRDIVKSVKEQGDIALFNYTKLFDKLELSKDNIIVSEEEIERAYSSVSNELLKSIRKAIKNVLDYHKRQVIPSDTGDKVGWIMKPLGIAGVYVPGGTAPYPSSVLMCVLPAVAAGVKEIIMATPRPENPLTMVAARECGVKSIYKIGGAQAIAAMAYGTESVPKVDIIAGPGNVYVALAKKEVFGSVAIDMIAGPSEILIIADDTAKTEYVIADLLSQAEHDTMSASILITTSNKLAEEVSSNIMDEGRKLNRRGIIEKSLMDNCSIIKVDRIEQAIEISDRIAPEHLELCVKDAEKYVKMINNAGAIFVGNYSPEPLGDYLAGPSHVLPTSGTARHFSVLSATTFTKRISVINYTKEDFMKVNEDIIRIAESENFDAHSLSIKVRSTK